MYTGFTIKPPFFEFGPKAYLYGADLLRLVRKIDRIAMKYDLDVIITPPHTDIRLLAENTERVFIFAQHMDFLPVGRGMGAALPEAIKAAGACGAMLNHAEKPLSLRAIQKTIARADEVGLATIVCADTPSRLEKIAGLSPNLLVAEPTELIGTGKVSDEQYVTETIERVRRINPAIMVLQGAGISSGEDVSRVIRLGALGTGSTSGIIKAADPAAKAEEMLCALRTTWDEIHGEKS